MKYYEFGRSTFSHFVWIKREAVFVNPVGLSIEMITPGVYGIEVYRANGFLAAKARRENRNGGWSSFYFDSGGEFSLRPGAYKIKLVNLSASKKFLKQGSLDYHR